VPTVVTLAEMKLKPQDLFHHILTVGAGKLSIFDRQVTSARAPWCPHVLFYDVASQSLQGVLLCDAPIPNPPVQKALLADVNSDGLQVSSAAFFQNRKALTAMGFRTSSSAHATASSDTHCSIVRHAPSLICFCNIMRRYESGSFGFSGHVRCCSGGVCRAHQREGHRRHDPGCDEEERKRLKFLVVNAEKVVLELACAMVEVCVARSSVRAALELACAMVEVCVARSSVRAARLPSPVLSACSRQSCHEKTFSIF
jgi:hypothetical protein